MRCSSDATVLASLRHSIGQLEAWKGPFQRDLCADLLKQCCRLRALDEARRLHGVISRAGQTQDNLLANSLIQIYGHHGRLQESRSLFQSLRTRNLFSWNMIVAAYARSGHLLEAKKLFDSLYQRNPFTWSLLISAFNEHHQVFQARALFEMMPHHSVVPSNVLLTAYARSGQTLNLQDLFMGMPERSIVSWNTILDTHIVHEDLAAASIVFEKIPNWDVVSYTTMLAGYARAGDVVRARALFSRIPEPNVVSWNALMEAHAAAGDLDAVRHIFEAMPARTIVSWNELIQAIAELSKDLDGVREIFGKIPYRSIVSWNCFLHGLASSCHSAVQYEEFRSVAAAVPEMDVVTSTMAIAAAARAGNLEDAGGIFDAMSSPRNLICWNCILQAYAEAGQLLDVVKTFTCMPGHDTFSCNTMLTAFAHGGKIQSAKDLFFTMPRRSPVSWNALGFGLAQVGHLEESRKTFDLSPMRNISSWNGMMKGYIAGLDLNSAREIFDASPDRPLCLWSGMILAYSQNGRSKDAIRLFQLMDFEGMDPDRETLAAILDACAVLSDFQVGKIVVEHLGGHSAAATVDLVLGGSIVNMYGKCGCLIEAERSFDLMPEKNLIVWNTMIAAFAHNGHFERCLEAFQSMLLQGIDPDSVSLLTVLSACSHAGKLHQAIEIFLSSGQDHGVAPTLWHYCCVIDLLGRAGKLADAEEIIRGMPPGSARRDESAVWQSFLSSCRSHGDADRGRVAARRAAELEPSGSSSYAALAGVVNGGND